MLFFLFLLGLSVGSFLNVLIDRLPKNESILGRSRCDHCKHQLSWYDLIPLFSFFALGRKCRYCGKRLSWQYPIVELITGLLFIFVFLSLPLNYQFFIIYHLFILSGLIVIFFADLKYRIIPDQVLFFLLLSVFFYLVVFKTNSISSYFISAIAAFLLFALLVVITKGRGMGLGDVKLAFVMGLILGFPLIVVGLYLSFLTGAAISLILVIRGRKTMKSTIPFGPFLAFSTGMSLFYGQSLWEVFRRLLGL